jgi:tetratricopeptide (TPR) repeat protein
MKFVLTLVLSVAASLPIRVEATETCPKDAAQAARRLYDEGAKHYHLNEFGDAAELFKEAYKTCPTPTVLYNLGQSYRLMGENEKAVQFYRQYLSTSSPDDGYRDDVAKLIRALQDELQKKKQVKESPPTGVAPPSSNPQGAISSPSAGATPAVSYKPEPQRKRRPWYQNRTGWGLTSGGLLAAIAGAALLGVGAGQEQQALNAPSQAVFDTHHSNALTYEKAAWPLIGIGGAVTVAGIIVFGVQK